MRGGGGSTSGTGPGGNSAKKSITKAAGGDQVKDIEKKIIEHVIQVMTYSSCMILSKQYLDISEYGKQIDNRLVNVQFFTDKQIGV